MRDHPRMRGEKVVVFTAYERPYGSPPHARGKAIASFIQTGVGGITPACAGKSSLLSSSGALYWDHPRMRGEKGRRFVH